MLISVPNSINKGFKIFKKIYPQSENHFVNFFSCGGDKFLQFLYRYFKQIIQQKLFSPEELKNRFKEQKNAQSLGLRLGYFCTNKNVKKWHNTNQF